MGQCGSKCEKCNRTVYCEQNKLYGCSEHTWIEGMRYCIDCFAEVGSTRLCVHSYELKN